MRNIDLVESACRSIINALNSPLKIVKIGPEDHKIVLTKCEPGDEINDPECEFCYEALIRGIFRRYTVSRTNKPDSFTWMHYSPANQEDLAARLGDEIRRMERFEQEALSMDACWQKMQAEDADKRIKSRDAYMARRRENIVE